MWPGLSGSAVMPAFRDAVCREMFHRRREMVLHTSYDGAAECPGEIRVFTESFLHS